MTSPDSPENDRPFSILPAILSYLVPGLGQIVQGRVGKGLLFMVLLLSLFHVGQAMGEYRNVYIPDLARGPEENFRNNPWKLDYPFRPLANILNHRWHFAGQFWIGIAAWPAIFQYNQAPLPLSENYPFLKDYQKAPFEEELNEILPNRDKTPDLAWVYTVIAGMLNILVIYDALAGPAYGAGGPRPQQTFQQTAQTTS